MHTDAETGRGPLLGGPAPLIEAISPKRTRQKDRFKGGWIILISHSRDLLPLFKTRTINYILCKRRTRIVMLESSSTAGSISGGNFLTRYITRHNVTFLDDQDNVVSSSYGLTEGGPHEEVKGVFVIDPRGILRMKLYFDTAHPRKFYEILKLVDALQDTDRQKKRKPAASVWKRRLSIVGRTESIPEEG
jgi:hypothetical protein